MDESTQEIIEAVLAGDLDQYRKLVREFEADVYRLAAPILGSRSSAEDLAQEVFIVAYDRLDSFDCSQPFRPWLLGIAANLVRNELRRCAREGRRMELYSRYLEFVTRDDVPALSGSARSDALARCREQLAGPAIAAIRARYDEAMELEDVANRLQRSVTATRQLLYRARLALRDCIESQLAAEGGQG